MNLKSPVKHLKIALALLAIITTGLLSCNKDANPELIKVSSAAIPGYTPTIPTTPGGGSTTPGTNTGDGGVAIGATNTIIVRLGTTNYTLKNPDDLLTLEVSKTGLVSTSIGAGTDVSEKSFGLLSGGTAVGIFDVQLAGVKVNGVKYLASQGDGKVKYTKIDVLDSDGKKGTVQGTFDITGTDIDSGTQARIVGSFNITQ